MSIYKQTLTVIGKEPKKVHPCYFYRSYKNGSFKIFQDEMQAKDHSNLIEEFCVNETEYEKYKNDIINYEKKFLCTLKNLLFKKYPSPFFESIFDTSILLSENNLQEVEFLFDVLMSLCDKILNKKVKPDVKFQEKCSGISESENYQLGLLYPEGFYAGSMNGYYYFVENNNNKALNWDEAMSYYNSSDFVLPTKDELIMMYKNTSLFNSNCPDKEQFNNNWYWSCSEYNSTNTWAVNFIVGTVTNYYSKKFSFLVRGVCKIPMN
jgi:hypothetical protein